MSNKVTVMPPSRLPAARKFAVQWARFDWLMKTADAAVAEYESLGASMLKLRTRQPGDSVPPLLHATLSEEFKANIARCLSLLEQFDADTLYEEESDEDGCDVLRQEHIAERLGLMLGCVDTGPTNTDPNAFAHMMMMHVYGEKIRYPALLSGCREIEQANKPVRPIGYVIEVLRKHDSEWQDRRRAIT
jgi:hypothetical protein